MSEAKLFAGPRVRRIRNGLGLTQTAMAEGLGISPSYLNLIERNQRPLTVQLLLKLASVYKVDLEGLRGEAGGSVAELKAVFADPLLAGELPGDQELVEIAEAAPNATAGIIRLYRAYREQAERLRDLSALLSAEGGALAGAIETRLPVDAVRDLFESRPNVFPELDTAAEAFHATLDSGDELASALKDWLRREQGVAVRSLPVHVMPAHRRRYDRHSLRLFLSERLTAEDQLEEVAAEVAGLALSEAIGGVLARLPLEGPEARRIARRVLTRYAARALIMPLSAFHAACQRARYDLDMVRTRFRASFQQCAERMTTLKRPGLAAPGFFLLEVDQAGNRLQARGAEGFPRQRFGGHCPKLGLHRAFAQPGTLLAEIVDVAGGGRYLTLSRTVEGPQAGFGEQLRRTALLLGCEEGGAGETVYGAGALLKVDAGPACRLCERQGCLARAEAPVIRPLGLDERVSGLSSFDFE
ncbi:Cro/Cl family transcriptional regulator [Rhizobium rhizosphaerae]|uniref:Cro/Cl family transcriptional regulator n=1 Tax=Xaviernesmea rhizosphaerae TaxID=1672749 RepID=A0A1Q9AIU4_9HYPH|nr:XRE family transcriptional regulator [Xaviernesmea rhizosphaerae]OLP55128.1 Cro/Cl family transcriptional regulator [Xaviernesmea rhizosphaerae]